MPGFESSVSRSPRGRLRLLLLGLGASALSGISGCKANPPEPGLAGSWRLIEVDGQPVSVGAAQREPNLDFASTERVVSGHTGCNSLRGKYDEDPQGFRFQPLITTKMACVAPEAMALEQALVGALGTIAAKRLTGDTLELLDSSGKVRLRLERRRPG